MEAEALEKLLHMFCCAAFHDIERCQIIKVPCLTELEMSSLIQTFIHSPVSFHLKQQKSKLYFNSIRRLKRSPVNEVLYDIGVESGLFLIIKGF